MIVLCGGKVYLLCVQNGYAVTEINEIVFDGCFEIFTFSIGSQDFFFLKYFFKQAIFFHTHFLSKTKQKNKQNIFNQEMKPPESTLTLQLAALLRIKIRGNNRLSFTNYQSTHDLTLNSYLNR